MTFTKLKIGQEKVEYETKYTNIQNLQMKTINEKLIKIWVKWFGYVYRQIH